MPTIEAKLNVPTEVYVSLPQRPDRVRECINAAEQAMNEEAAQTGWVISETPRLVGQQMHQLIDQVELTFQAEAVRR
jgi:hypothetical protein